MSATPRLSIGLPVYNSESYLARSLESLLGQTYEDFELIISDNASTDSTRDICVHYARQDSRVRYMRQPRNIGLAPNHNFVFARSRGEFFKWAAADDLYGRDLLQRCVDALDEHPDVVLAHAYEAVIDETDRVTQALEYPLETDSHSASRRFRSFLFGSSGIFDSGDDGERSVVRFDNRGVLRACDEYGVIRSAALHQTGGLGSYHHSDRIVVAELVLRGRFHITPEWLYFRREYADRSYNVSPSVRNRCVILDPARASRLRHPTARLVGEYFWGYVSAIREAPLPDAERRECYRQLARWLGDRATNRIVTRPLQPIDGQFSPLLRGRELRVRDVVAGSRASTP